MEGFVTNQGIDNLGFPVKKRKRTQNSRRPRLHFNPFSATHYASSQHLSSNVNVYKDSSSHRVSRISSSSGGDEGDFDVNGGNNAFSNSSAIQCVLALANNKSKIVKNGESQVSKQLPVSLNNTVGNEGKVKRVLKLKVGGVTCTIRANSEPDTGVSGTNPSTRGSRSSKPSKSHKRKSIQGNTGIDDEHSPLDIKSSISGVQRMDFSKRDFSLRKQDILAEKMAGKQISKPEAVRKSRRTHKRRVMDGEFGEDDEDDEIRYLEKLKRAKITAGHRDYDEEPGMGGKFSKISNMEKTGATGFGKDVKKKARSDRPSNDTDYEEEEEQSTDGEKELKKKQRKDSGESLVDTKGEMTLTTRQRALQSSRDGSCDHGTGLIEFPNGLPPAPPKKQKEKLSDVEQQLKKAEAAQRRRMQVEKAARESEAEAIRKILGHDSARKKREEKKKRQEQLAQEKAANELQSQINCIRLVMGPNGTTVTFPKDAGFPAIFNSKPCSYPPPREKCAGPSCTNAYKYRDSKTKLPLCSLQCYKAIHGNMKDEFKNVC